MVNLRNTFLEAGCLLLAMTAVVAVMCWLVLALVLVYKLVGYAV